MSTVSMQAELLLTREEAADAGERIYDERLKSTLERKHRGRVIAIYIPSQDYFLGDSLIEASDHLREEYPSASSRRGLCSMDW
jgi:hypothetical protein